MNAGNQRVGGALGFRISYLLQLKSLRTADNKSSLLHFVIGTLERKFPQVLEFPQDLSYTSKAARGICQLCIHELCGSKGVSRGVE